MAHSSGMKAAGPVLAIALLFIAFFSFSAAGAEETAAPADAMLESGVIVNKRMKTVAAGADTQWYTITEDIRAIRMADALPDGFVPSEANTVSTSDSRYPIYIFFDNEDGAGILYFYTEADRITMNPDSKILFSRHTALKDISGLADWDASRVESMYGMFMNDRSLPDALAIRRWDTSGVTDMGDLFARAVSLMYVDVSGWNTGKVTSMQSMFAVGDSWKANGELREIFGLGDLDTSNVTDMTCMFYGAGKMTYYDVARWDVSKVESMNHMFCDNFQLRMLDLSAWDVSSVKTMYCMFDDNRKLTTIGDVSHWNTASLIDAGAWLNGARSFVGNDMGMLDLSGWDTRNLKSTGEMFYYTGLHEIDLSGWSFDSLTNDGWEGAGSGIYYEYGNGFEEFFGMGGMFLDSDRIKTVYVSESTLESFNAAVERGVNTEKMWYRTKAGGFTVK